MNSFSPSSIFTSALSQHSRNTNLCTWKGPYHKEYENHFSFTNPKFRTGTITPSCAVHLQTVKQCSLAVTVWKYIFISSVCVCVYLGLNGLRALETMATASNVILQDVSLEKCKESKWTTDYFELGTTSQDFCYTGWVLVAHSIDILNQCKCVWYS